MSALSDLHILAMRHLKNGDSIEHLANISTYPEDDIEWAVRELRETDWGRKP